MSKSKLRTIADFIMTLAATYVFLKFGFSVQAMITVLVEHVKLGTPVLTALKEPQFAMLGVYIVTGFFSGFVLGDYVDYWAMRLLKWLKVSKEEQDVRNFRKWVKKEQKRLRKLEGTW